jgi:hypothetical protein
MLCTKEKNKPMKSNELRIGNWITWKSTGKIEMVEKVDVYGLHVCVNDVNIEDALPIPLTEEWLIRFGFENNSIPLNTPEKTLNISAVVNGDHFLFLDDVFGSFYDLNCIRHVHQVQNLYFALTGEELETK